MSRHLLHPLRSKLRRRSAADQLTSGTNSTNEPLRTTRPAVLGSSATPCTLAVALSLPVCSKDRSKRLGGTGWS
jgi:hypothetical protein